MSEQVSKANAKELVYEYIAVEQENTALEKVYDWLFEQVVKNK